MKLFSRPLLLLSLANVGLAHPGHVEPESELIYKRNFNAQTRRGLSACADKLQKRGVYDRAQERRAATVAKYRAARGAAKRDTDTIANTSHLSNLPYTPDTVETTIFGESNTCIINPEGETGPYWVKGEYLRSNVRENQTGIPIVIEGQFLDIETCEPLTNVWWDIWNCNATGVYAGVVENGNGNSDDTSNVNTTFLRGIQQTDSDGVVTFESIFPGHYSGRATHHHMIVYLDATVEDNNTLSGGTYAHVGQAFWDQDLITKVEATYPYNTNTIDITENIDDRVFSTETADTTSDPVFQYVYLGDDLSDGLFGWLTVVVNTSATYDPAYSFELTADGGISATGGSDTVDGSFDGSTGNSTGMGNSTGGAMPSGSMPSGAMSGAAPSGFTNATASMSLSAATSSASNALNSSSVSTVSPKSSSEISTYSAAASTTTPAGTSTSSSGHKHSTGETLSTSIRSSSTKQPSMNTHSSSASRSQKSSSGNSKSGSKGWPNWWSGNSRSSDKSGSSEHKS